MNFLNSFDIPSWVLGRQLPEANITGLQFYRPPNTPLRSVMPLVRSPISQLVTRAYISGWITIFARISVMASAAYVAGSMIQGLIILNFETYVAERWHSTMLYWSVLTFSACVNILGIRYFPHIETLAFIFHICLFFVFLVPLVYLSPQSSASFVFAGFENSSGWKNDGVSWFIGLLTSAWSFVGVYLSFQIQFLFGNKC